MHLAKQLLSFCAGLLALAILSTQPAAARQEASIVIDFDTGEVVHARSADARAFPASLTKMMTLYLTFEAIERGQLSLSSRLRVSGVAAAKPPTKLGLKSGSTIKTEDAILALVTKSANDAAAVIAENLGGTESKFGLLMTRRARDLGMSSTVFRNASGLPDPEQRTTARDMARLAIRLIQDYPQYYSYFSRRSFTYLGRKHGNHNRLLGVYSGMDGLKTGYTRASGFNLAASAVRNGRRLVAVVLGGSTARARDAVMVDVLDDAFERLKKRAPAPLVAAVPQARPGAAAEVVALPEAAAVPAVVALAAAAPEALAAPALDSAAIENVIAVPAVRPALPELEETAATPARTVKPARQTAKKRLPYGVQVGAYTKQSQAKQAAQQAMKRVPDLLRGTFMSVSGVKQRKRTIYRAMLIGLSKQEADSVCRQLKKAKQGCLVVRTGPLDVAAN